MIRNTIHALAIAVIAVSPVFAEGPQIRSERVKFAAGSSSATIKGTIKGEQTVDYLLGANAGQTMSVSLKSSNASNYFNVMEPGSQGEAIFVGSTSGNEFSGALGKKGDHTVRVYLMRNAARRNETANYTITFKITNATAGAAPGSDATVKGTKYHATGNVPCSIGGDPKRSAQCGFGVIRGAAGKAEVHLTAPGDSVKSPGATKFILKFEGSKVTASDPALKLEAVRDGDEWSIGINGYDFYSIPEAVVVGG